MVGKVRKIAVLLTLFCCQAIVMLLFCQLPSACVRADNDNDYSELSLSIGESSHCVRRKNSIKLTCTLRRTNVNKYKVTGFVIEWDSKNGFIARNLTKILENNTAIVSTITVYVNWTKDKVFTCFVKSRPVLNASVTLISMPRMQIKGARFIEGKDKRLVEIYWKQSMEFNYTYNLIYNIYTDDHDDDDDFYDGGPNSGRADYTECMCLSRDIYRVPNTTGHICKAVIDNVKLFCQYKVHLETIGEQCQTSGLAKEFQLENFGTEDDGPNKKKLFLIPHSVENVSFSVAKRRVELTWSKPNTNLIKFRMYRLKYNCSDFKEQSKTIKEQTNLTLYSNDFFAYKPYALCQFCIQVRFKASNVFSEPLCRKARLHEEVPSEAPKITCMEDQCKTTNDGRYRNVTITWSLPPRETWNGVLTHVAITYRRANGGKKCWKVMERNLTQEFTMLTKLEQNTSYIVEMAACNSEGCSQNGKPSVVHLLSEQQVQNQKSNSSNDVASSLHIYVSLGIGLPLLVAVGVFMWFVRHRNQRQREQNQLPDVKEPCDAYDDIGDQLSAKYDELSNNGSTEHGEWNMGSDPSDDEGNQNVKLADA